MFVCPGNKVAVDSTITTFVIQASKSSNCIGRRSLIRVTHVRWSIGVVDGGGDVESLFLLGVSVVAGSSGGGPSTSRLRRR
jgi:hypothetical protein